MRTRDLAAAAAAALTLTLAGCIPSLPFSPGTIGDVIEQTTGGGDVPVVPSASVPGDWPSELPLPDGQLITATSIENTQSLVYRIADPSVGERLIAELVSRGFALEASSDMGQLVTNMLKRGDWPVSVGWLIGDDEVTLTYVSGTH